MTTASCKSLNFSQNRSITDTFDKYVVLAFVLTILLTIIIILCLVKYITYNIQQDKEREKMIQERSIKPARIEEDGPADSDEEYAWSDDEQETVVDFTAEIEEENRTVSLISDLNTNYVHGIFSLDDEDSENDEFHQIGNLNNMDWLIMWLHLDENLQKQEDHSPSQVLKQIFYSKGTQYMSYSFSSLSLYQDCFLKIASFRKVSFLQILNFSVDLLCNLRVLPQQIALSLKTKYEQKFERLDKSSNIHGLFALSKILLFISQKFTKELEEIINDKEIADQILPYIYSQPLDCLKMFMLSLTDLNKLCMENSKAIVAGIRNCERVTLLIKSRFFYLRNTIQKISKEKTNNQLPEVLSEFETNIKGVFTDFQTKFRDALKAVEHLHTLRLEEQKQLFIKLEEDINLLKLEVINSQGTKFFDKLKKFSELMTSFFVAHLEESNKYYVVLNHQENENIKTIFSDVQKYTFSRMKDIEEWLMTVLKQKCNFSDDSIILVAKNVQESLKATSQAYESFVSECTTSSVKNVNQASKFMHLFIDYILKYVSSRYKSVLAANVASIKSWPSIQEHNIEKLSLSIRGEMSMAAFDVVFALTSNFFSEMTKEEQVCTQTVPRVNIEYIFQENVFENQINPNLQEVLESTVLNHIGKLSPFNIPEHFLDHALKEYDCIILKAFDKLTVNFNTKIKKEIITSIEGLFTENLLICNVIKKQLSVAVKSNSSSKKANSKYMSRKGSSYKEKSLNTEIFDLYQGLLDVKEHKYDEKCQALSAELQSHGKESTKSSTSFCVKYLNKQLDFLQLPQQEKEMEALFALEQYYMKEMFLKKIKQIKNEEEPDELKQRNSVHHKDPPTPQGRPQSIKKKASKSSSSSVRTTSASPAKTSVLSKKRKSRRIRDNV